MAFFATGSWPDFKNPSTSTLPGQENCYPTHCQLAELCYLKRRLVAPVITKTNFMGYSSIQGGLFQRIREKLTPDMSLAEHIAEVLCLSADSAYRRIRGETPLVLEEVKTLCDKHSISMDQLLQAKHDSVLFTVVKVNEGNDSFMQFLQQMLQRLKMVASANDKELIYLSKEIVVFHYFLYPPLFAFQYFFWLRSVLSTEDIVHKFSFDVLHPEMEALGREILSVYNSIPSIEIWNSESINNTISQIEFFREAGLFHSGKDVEIIYDSLRSMLIHLQLQCEQSCKFLPGENPQVKKNNFRFFHNREGLADNTIMALTNGSKTLYLNYETLNYMYTQDHEFCNSVHVRIQKLLRRSTILSGVSEKQRYLFFNSLMNKIPNRHKLQVK
ncbi:MAG TPA: helix-turn-helix domain-containing protein [Flavisolibacter sp.]|nr:helix-turn-helix domain-containing protein [Flavisolibacter sp.]